VMSAGTGVYHSEYNPDEANPAKFLQIWVFPNKRNVAPRYDQITIDAATRNEFVQVLSPNADDAGVWIYQDAWFNMGRFDAETVKTYNLHKEGNGAYIFVLKGSINIDGQNVSTRDGFGIWDTDKFEITASTDAEFLIMEVPMKF